MEYENEMGSYIYLSINELLIIKLNPRVFFSKKLYHHITFINHHNHLFLT